MTTFATPDSWNPPLVVILGLGMCRQDLSLAALEWLEKAEVLAGGKRHLDQFADHPGEKICFQSPIEKSIQSVKRISRKKRTLVIASGDPLFFGVGKRLSSILGEERIFVVPNVTSVQVLFSRLRQSWENVRVVSLHGRSVEEAAAGLAEVLGARQMAAVLTGNELTPAWIAERILESGCSGVSMIVGEDLGAPSESIRRLSPEEARPLVFSPLNLVVLDWAGTDPVRGATGKPGQVLGIPEEEFERDGGLITKMEIRAAVLANLQLEQGLVLWDIGAGSGSVSIEASRIARLKFVAAIEKNARRYRKLANNIRNFGCAAVKPFHGTAPGVLDALPGPDRVFIGGSGKELEAILDVVSERLRPLGRVVQTVVTLETLERVRCFWQEKGFDVSVSQIQVSRSVAIGKTARLEALNPVFIICARRKR